jgi:hypothetical protein
MGVRCGWFGGIELIFRPCSHEERVRRIERVSAEDVRNVAQRVLRKDRITTVAVGALEGPSLAQGAEAAERVLRAVRTSIEMERIFPGPTASPPRIGGISLDRLTTLVAFAAGILWFLRCGGGRALDPSRIDWFEPGDQAAHYFGATFFAQAPWSIPLGKIPSLIYPIGSNVLYTDSLPWVVLLVKLLRPLLGARYQFFGLWLALAYGLNAVFGARIARLATDRPTSQVLSGLLFAQSPILGNRPQLTALTTHWIILAAVLLGLRQLRSVDSKRSLIFKASVLGGFAIGIHPYLWAMAMLVLIGALVTSERDRAMNWRALALGLLSITASSALVAGLWGFRPDTMSRPGFGYYSANLLSFLSEAGDYRHNWSRFIGPIPVGPGQYEGFGYLGLGAVFLILVGVSASRFLPRRTIRRALPLIAVACFCLLFAISGKVMAGEDTLFDWSTLLSPLEVVTSTFRSSGRFIWVPHYMLLSAAVLVVSRYYPRRASLLLMMAVVVQTIELEPPVSRFAPKNELEHVGSLEVARPDYQHVQLLPPQVRGACEGPFADEAIDVEAMASAVPLTFSAGRDARVPAAAVARYCSSVIGEVRRGIFRADTIYVVDPSARAWVAGNPGVVCGSLARRLLCVTATRDTALLRRLAGK